MDINWFWVVVIAFIVLFVIGGLANVLGEQGCGCLGCLGIILIGFWVVSNFTLIATTIVVFVARWIRNDLIVDEVKKALELAEDDGYFEIIKTVFSIIFG